MFDKNLAKDFEVRYKQFIIDTTKPLQPEYMLCFEGFIDNMFVRIGRTSNEANKINQSDFACFIFRNMTNPVNRVLTLPIKCTLSNDYDKYYYQFQIKKFKELPAEFTDFLSNKRIISKAKPDSFTSFSRIIAGCLYKLHNGTEQLQAHHWDKNSLNDHIDNLVPVTQAIHIGLMHNISVKELEIEKFFCKANSYTKEKCQIMTNIILKSPYLNELFQRFKTKDYSIVETDPYCDLSKELWRIHYMIAFMEGKERNYSRYFNNDALFAMHYLKYFEGLKGRDFDKIGKRYNGIELPSGRTMRDYLQNSIYREFEAYFYYITNNQEKLSTIQKTNFNFIISNQDLN